jgi:hypothetical protein
MLLNKVCNFVPHAVNMHYINHKYIEVQITKYNSRQLSNSCMFRREGAIRRDFIWTKQHKNTTPPATIYSHAPFGWHPLGSNRSIQMFVQVYVPHTECKLLRICVWSGSLSYSVNITTLYFHIFQVYVSQNFNISVISVVVLRYPVCRVGFVFLCPIRFPADGIPLPQYWAVWYLSWIVFYDL